MIERGNIYWADLGPVVDRGPAKRRPVLLVQSEQHNESRMGTVIVAVVTSNTARAVFPGNVFLPAEATNLPRDSVAVCTALVTLDRDRLDEAVGTLPASLMGEVDVGLRRALGL